MEIERAGALGGSPLAFSGRPLLENPPSRPARRRFSLSPGRMPSPSRRSLVVSMEMCVQNLYPGLQSPGAAGEFEKSSP